MLISFSTGVGDSTKRIASNCLEISNLRLQTVAAELTFHRKSHHWDGCGCLPSKSVRSKSQHKPFVFVVFTTVIYGVCPTTSSNTRVIPSVLTHGHHLKATRTENAAFTEAAPTRRFWTMRFAMTRELKRRPEYQGSEGKKVGILQRSRRFWKTVHMMMLQAHCLLSCSEALFQPANWIWVLFHDYIVCSQYTADSSSLSWLMTLMVWKATLPVSQGHILSLVMPLAPKSSCALNGLDSPWTVKTEPTTGVRGKVPSGLRRCLCWWCWLCQADDCRCL